MDREFDALFASSQLLRSILVRSCANEGMRSIAKAKIFDSEDDIISALGNGAIRKGEETVVTISATKVQQACLRC